MRTKSKTLRVKQDFPLSRANFRSWADDLTASVLPFFTQHANQTPLLALGKTVGKAARRAIVKSFRKQRERVTIVNSIPHSARCVAADLSVSKSSCKTCGQPAKELVSRIAFFIDGRPVEFVGRERFTVVTCPACGTASEGPVQGPATHVLIEKSGSSEPLFSEIDSL